MIFVGLTTLLVVVLLCAAVLGRVVDVNGGVEDSFVVMVAIVVRFVSIFVAGDLVVLLVGIVGGSGAVVVVDGPAVLVVTVVTGTGGAVVVIVVGLTVVTGGFVAVVLVGLTVVTGTGGVVVVIVVGLTVVTGAGEVIGDSQFIPVKLKLHTQTYGIGGIVILTLDVVNVGKVPLGTVNETIVGVDTLNCGIDV